jgi:hypothetical protein
MIAPRAICSISSVRQRLDRREDMLMFAPVPPAAEPSQRNHFADRLLLRLFRHQLAIVAALEANGDVPGKIQPAGLLVCLHLSKCAPGCDLAPPQRMPRQSLSLGLHGRSGAGDGLLTIKSAMSLAAPPND